MYLSTPRRSWASRLLGSARTLVAVAIIAVLAVVMIARWSDASANSAHTFTPLSSADIPSLPVAIEGTVLGTSESAVALLERGSDSPVAFPLHEDAYLVRADQAIAIDALRAGDAVRMTIDGRTGQVLNLVATPAARSPFAIRVPGAVALLAAVGLIVAGTALAIRNIERLPVLPYRLPAVQPLHVGATR